MYKTATSFLQNICRTCLCKVVASNSVKILSNKPFYKNQSLIAILYDTMHIVIDPKEMLPINICLKCVEKLKQTIAFKKTIERADRTLKSKLRQVEIRHCLKMIDSITAGLDAISDELMEITNYSDDNNDHIKVDINQLSKQKSPKDVLKENNKSTNQNDIAVIKDIIDSKNSKSVIVIQESENSDVEFIQPIDDPPVVEISDDEETQCVLQKVTNDSKNLTQKTNYNIKVVESKIVTKEQCSVKEKSSVEEKPPCVRNESIPPQGNLEKKPPWVKVAQGEYVCPPKVLACSKCDKRFSNNDFLERHLLYHSLDLEPIGNLNLRYTTPLHIRPLSDLTDPSGMAPKSNTVPERNKIIPKVYHNPNYVPPALRPPPTPPLRIYPPELEVQEECKYCKKSMKLGDLNFHINREHYIEYRLERNKFYRFYKTCNECPIRLKNAPQTLKHIILPHELKHECKYCNKFYSGSEILKNHIQKKHQPKPDKASREKKVYLCYICGKSCRSLYTHMQTHIKTKPFKCTFKDCNAMLKHKSTLKSHIMSVHKTDRPYICEHCGKQYALRGGLRQHIRTHTDDKPYTCFVCQKGFHLRSGLRKHLQSHQTRKPVTCPVCSQIFNDHNNMIRHCRIKHNPNFTNPAKSFVCTICSKVFVHMSSLTKHNKQCHSYLCKNQKVSDKVIQCTECERKFTHEYDLKKHIRLLHPSMYFNQKQKEFNT